MKLRQAGFGRLQIVLAILVIGAVALVAIPHYTGSVSRAKLTEAFNLADESRRKVSEFLMVSGRLPSTQLELEAMATTGHSPPQHIREMVLERGFRGNDLAIKVYLKDEEVENPTGEEQFIYVLGNGPVSGAYTLEWTCGANGVDPELLPEDCGS